LCAEEAEFLLVGAHALAAHGLPRATGDLDIWVRPSEENASKVWRALVRFGAPLEERARKDLESPDLILQIGVAPCRIDILTNIDGVDFGEAWKNRQYHTLDKLPIPVIGRAELIKNKKASGRPQDLADLSRLEENSEL
jgi:hypothetical protein